MTETCQDLHNGVALAELGGYGDGYYAARHGAGGALVMLGTYIVDAGDDVSYPPAFVFKCGRQAYAAYLEEHVAAARESGAKIGVSVVTVDMKDTLDFLQAAEAAGADFASYCAFSSMEMFVSRDLSSVLCRRSHWAELRTWAQAIVEAVNIPVIFKMGAQSNLEETAGAVDVLAEAGVQVVHICVGRTDPGAPGLKLLTALKGRCSCLIGGGGVTDAEGAARVIAAGDNAVAIGTAAMKDPGLIGRIQKQLR